MKLQPLGNRVLVRRTTAQTTKGGILLPESAQEQPREGEVVAVGPGIEDRDGKRRPPGVHVGDRVIFASYGGVEVKDQPGGEEHLILAEDDILGILS